MPGKFEKRKGKKVYFPDEEPESEYVSEYAWGNDLCGRCGGGHHKNNCPVFFFDKSFGDEHG